MIPKNYPKIIQSIHQLCVHLAVDPRISPNFSTEKAYILTIYSASIRSHRHKIFYKFALGKLRLNTICRCVWHSIVSLSSLSFSRSLLKFMLNSTRNREIQRRRAWEVRWMVRKRKKNRKLPISVINFNEAFSISIHTRVDLAFPFR